MNDVPLIVSLHEEQKTGQWPVTVGIPFSEGELMLRSATEFFVRAETEDNVREYPAQCVPLAMWEAEGPGVRWLLVDFMVDACFHQHAPTYHLVAGLLGSATSPLLLTKDSPGPGQLTVAVGLETRFVIDHGGVFGISSVEHGGVRLVNSDHPQRFQVTKAKDNLRYEAVCKAPGEDAGTFEPTPVVVEDSGGVRIGLRFSGFYRNVDDHDDYFCQFVIRLQFHARSRLVRMLHTFIFTGNEKEQGHRIRDLAIEVPLAAEIMQTHFGVDAESPTAFQPTTEDASILQYRHGRFEPIAELLSQPGTTNETLVFGGKRSSGWLSAQTGSGSVAIGMRHAWQSYPNELEVRDGMILIHLWPLHDRSRPSRGHTRSQMVPGPLDYSHQAIFEHYRIPQLLKDHPEYQVKRDEIADSPNVATGTARSHELWFDFRPGAPPSPEPVALQCSEPAYAMASPAHNCASGALGPMHPQDCQTYPEVEAMLNAIFERYRIWRDTTGGYGWFDFFDVHAQHQTGATVPVDGGVMPNKLERYWASTWYGFPLVPWILFYRSGDRRLLDDAEANSRHCMDVDRCHVTDFTDPTRVTWAGTHHSEETSLVHWSSGPVGSSYNQLEFLLFFYYLRGDRRALEVMLDYGAGMVEELRPHWVLPETEALTTPFVPANAYDGDEGRFNFKGARHLGAPLGNLVELGRAAMVPDVDSTAAYVHVPQSMLDSGDYLNAAAAYFNKLREVWEEATDAEKEQWSPNLRWVWDGLLNLSRFPKIPKAGRLIHALAELQAHEGAVYSFVSAAAAVFYGDPDADSVLTPEDILRVAAADLDLYVSRTCVRPEGSSPDPNPEMISPDPNDVVETIKLTSNDPGSLAALEGTGGYSVSVQAPYVMRSVPYLLAAIHAKQGSGESLLGRGCTLMGPRISTLRVMHTGTGCPRLLVRLGRWQAFRLVSQSECESSDLFGELHQYPQDGPPQYVDEIPPGEFIMPTGGLVTLTEASLKPGVTYRLEFLLHTTRKKDDAMERGRVVVAADNLHLEIDPIEESTIDPEPGRISAFGPKFFFRVPAGVEEFWVRMRIPSPSGMGWSPAVCLSRHDGAESPEEVVRFHGHETGGTGELIGYGEPVDPWTHEAHIIYRDASQSSLWSIGPFPLTEMPFPNMYQPPITKEEGEIDKPEVWRPPYLHDPRWFQIRLPDDEYLPVSPFESGLFPEA